MFYEILDDERKKLLPKLACFKDRFYLAGGTALALQLGHRDSEDFDFFTPEDFDVQSLIDELRSVLDGYKWQITQEEKNTVSVIVNEKIKLSFFKYPYLLLELLLDEPYLKIASVSDIAGMKFSAIVGRATMKDYVDIYYILQQFDLAKLLELSQKKMPNLDRQLILKSLVYFADVLPEKLKFKEGYKVEWSVVQKTISESVKNYLAKMANLDI